MKSELERTKEALEWVLGSPLSGNSQLVKVSIDAILNPPPEMEDVEETAGWVNVYRRMGGHLYIGGMLPDKDAADQFASDAGNPKVGTQEIKVKVLRTKKQPVERSVSVEAQVQDNSTGTPGYVVGKGDGEKYNKIVFYHHPECHGKTGVLTFTWQEEQ